MTQTESASSLEAGRELDALIAEKVMGWESRGPHPLFGTLVFNCGRGDNLLPKFSTDIAAAWPLVERFYINVFSPLRSDDGWAASAKVRTETGWRGGIVGKGSTAPLAICLAALKAVEGGEG